MDWVTTSTILEQLRDYQNDRAWTTLSARFRKPIESFARGLGLSDPDAEDVAQETMVAFAKGYREGRYDRARGRLSQWLFGIAYRQALNARRRDARRGDKVHVGANSSFWADLPDEQAATQSWDQEWEKALLNQCIEQVEQEVEPQTFRAFALVVAESHAPADAAAQLGLPIKSVYNAKHRVLKRIRELRAELEDTATVT